MLRLMHILGHGVNSFRVITEMSIFYIGICFIGLGNPTTIQGSFHALPDSVHMGILRSVSAEMQSQRSNHCFYNLPNIISKDKTQ